MENWVLEKPDNLPNFSSIERGVVEVAWQADSRACLLSYPAHTVRCDSLVQLWAFYGLQTGCSHRTNSYNVASCIKQKSWLYC